MNRTLMSLIHEVRALPLSSSLVVFGSMLSRPDEAGDLDVAIVSAEPRDAVLDRIGPLARSLLSLGAHGSLYYGALDLFVVCPDALLVRHDSQASLINAKNARALRTAVENGERFDVWYDRMMVPRIAETPALGRDALQKVLDDEAKAADAVFRKRIGLR